MGGNSGQSQPSPVGRGSQPTSGCFARRRQVQCEHPSSLEGRLDPIQNTAVPLMLRFRRPVVEVALRWWYDPSEALNVVRLPDEGTAPVVTRPEASSLLKTHTAAPGEDRTSGPG